MTRKGTIIIAVLVNACLLIMLFITATTTEEEIFLDSTTVMHPPSSRQEIAMDKPLFEETVQKIPPSGHKDSLAEKTSKQTVEKTPETVVVKTSENVRHKLPKIAGAKPEVKAPVIAKQTTVVKKVEKAKVDPVVRTVTVKKGDTLERIAKRYGSTVKRIVAANHLPSTFLRIGQVLKVPTEKSTKVKGQNQLSSDATYYVVKPGDNPWTIAMKHHMKVNELLKLNHLDEKKAKRLKPGDRLRIR